MSDELIEGRSLRNRRLRTEDDMPFSAAQDFPSMVSSDPYDPPTEELPWIVLEPPTEGGGPGRPRALRIEDLARIDLSAVVPGGTSLATPEAASAPDDSPLPPEPASVDEEEGRFSVLDLSEAEVDALVEVLEGTVVEDEGGATGEDHIRNHDGPGVVDEAGEEQVPLPDPSLSDRMMRLPPIRITDDDPPTQAPRIRVKLPPTDTPFGSLPPVPEAAGPVVSPAPGHSVALPLVTASFPVVEAGEEPRKGGWRLRHYLLLTVFLVITLALLAIPVAWLMLGDLSLPALAAAPREATAVIGAVPVTESPAARQTPTTVIIAAPSLPATPTAAVASPERIVYSSNADGDFDLYLLDAASGESAIVTDLEGDERMPAPSPGGERIAFVSNVEGDDDIFVMDADGSNVIQVTRSTGADRSPAWSPDGSQIVFSRETVDGSNLYRFDTNCINPDAPCEDALVLVTSTRYDLFPVWSPDGTHIAFSASDFPGLPSMIALVALQELNSVNLPGTGASDFYPAWSPDGARIAFVSISTGEYNLFTMSAWTGGELLQITGSPGSDVGPAWSTDGSRLAFASDRDGQGFDLYLVASTCPSARPGCEDGLRQLTHNPGDELDPRWVP